MKYTIPIIFLLVGLLFLAFNPEKVKPIAQTPTSSNVYLGGIAYDYDCTKRDLEVDVNNLNGKTLYACFFSRETPNSKVFPDNMTGATFICSHLDNVIIPIGNTVIDNNGTCGSRMTYKVQKDGEDWILNAQLKPVEPVNKEYLLMKGKNINPAKIPK